MEKIGIVVDNDFYNDVRVFNECKIIASAVKEVHVLCFDFGRDVKKEIPKNIYVHKIKIKRKLKDLLFAFNNTFGLYNLFWSRQIVKFFRNTGIQQIHVHDLYMSKPTYIALKKSNIQFNLDLHENFPAAVEDYKWMWRFPYKYLIRPEKWKKLEKKYLSYPHNIVVLSETFRDDLLRKYDFLRKDQFVIYPNVPDLYELLSYKVDDKILDKNNDFIVFYFGGISERRGIFTAIESMKILKGKIPGIKLLLIGPVDKAEYKRFNEAINDNSIKNNIIWYKWKDISLLPSYITISHVCISPIVKNAQHESGVANKVFQYMLFERPLIVSDCKPQKQIIDEEKCGLTFVSEDKNDLADKIYYLYKNVNLRNAMGTNGKAAVIEKYNGKTIGNNLVKLYV